MRVMGRPAAEAALEIPAFAPSAMSGGDRSGERRLLRQAKRGDRAAIDRLVEMHWEGAYRTALLVSRDHAAAEDVAQEALILALRSLGRFDRRRRFGPWLHRIVTNRAIDHIRERRRRMELLKAGGERVPDHVDEAGLSPDLAEALGRLADEDRAIVVLRHLFDYRSEEIGGILGLPAGTVRRRLAGALKKLRVEMEGRT